MKKRSVLMTVLAVILVVVISVGSTLAYLTATDEKVVNTFTFGGMTVKLEEPDPSVPPEVSTSPNPDGGYDYSNVKPNSVLGKNPKVSTDTDVDAYLFIKVSGADDMIKPCIYDPATETVTESNPIPGNGWTPITTGKYAVDPNTYNGLYVRKIDVSADADKNGICGPYDVFQYVKVADKDIVFTVGADGKPVANEIDSTGKLVPLTVNLPTIKVEVFEIQAEGLTDATAQTKAEDFFDKNVVIPTQAPAAAGDSSEVTGEG